METLETIHKRRSIKKFLKTPVELDKLGAILDAGRVAPSAGNIQDRKFILVRDKSTIEAIARACLNQLWIAGAAAIIVIASKGEKTKYYYKKNAEFFIVQTCAAAAENMIIAATDMGIASTWVSAFNDHEIKNVLGIPSDGEPQVIIPIGYPDEIVPEPAHFELEHITYFERWGNKVKDTDWVLQNYNFLGRAIDHGEGFFNYISNAFQDIFNKFKKDKETEEHLKESDKQEIPKELESAKKVVDKKE
jgi:hypothetical protein